MVYDSTDKGEKNYPVLIGKIFSCLPLSYLNMTCKLSPLECLFCLTFQIMLFDILHQASPYRT